MDMAERGNSRQWVCICLIIDWFPSTERTAGSRPQRRRYIVIKMTFSCEECRAAIDAYSHEHCHGGERMIRRTHKNLASSRRAGPEDLDLGPHALKVSDCCLRRPPNPTTTKPNDDQTQRRSLKPTTTRPEQQTRLPLNPTTTQPNGHQTRPPPHPTRTQRPPNSRR